MVSVNSAHLWYGFRRRCLLSLSRIQLLLLAVTELHRYMVTHHTVHSVSMQKSKSAGAGMEPEDLHVTEGCSGKRWIITCLWPYRGSDSLQLSPGLLQRPLPRVALSGLWNRPLSARWREEEARRMALQCRARKNLFPISQWTESEQIIIRAKSRNSPRMEILNK